MHINKLLSQISPMSMVNHDQLDAKKNAPRKTRWKRACDVLHAGHTLDHVAGFFGTAFWQDERMWKNIFLGDPYHIVW